MTKYICQLCGYKYNPLVGDADNDVEPETEFDELPSDWICPLCGAGKDDFETLEEDEEEDYE